MSSGKNLIRSDQREPGLFARIRNRISCLRGKHEPDRKKVTRTGGIFYTGVCKHCGVRIRKRDGYPWRAAQRDD